MSGLTSVWSDLKESLFPTVAFADEDESAAEPEQPQDEEEAGDDAAPAEDNEAEEAEDDEDEDEEEDDDDEDEDELKDPLDTLREKYTETVCHDFKHHFDECVERVTKAQSEPGYDDLPEKEDCVEEFFHLQHCLNDQIAPVLFSKLK